MGERQREMAANFAKLPELLGRQGVTSSEAGTEATYRHRDVACASLSGFIIAARYGNERIFIQRNLIDQNFVFAYRSSVVGLLPGGIP